MSGGIFTTDVVRDALRTVRKSGSLLDSPLLHSRALARHVRSEGLSDTIQSRAAHLPLWLEAHVLTLQARLLGSTEARPRGPLPSQAALESLKADFACDVEEREALGVLYFRYFSGSRMTLQEAATKLDVSRRTLRRRLHRGYALLATALRIAEDETIGTAVRGHHVPQPMTSFIGRDQEIARLRTLLATHRLVTLTGLGGMGKSRLAIYLANDLASDFADGVWFIDVAALKDKREVPYALLDAFGLREAPRRSPRDVLIDRLASMRLLLVVDNCEHLVEACSALIGDLLLHCPSMQVLATSREALTVAGGATWNLPPMSMPDDLDAQRASQVMHYDAIRLFRARAVAADSGFEITNGNAGLIGAICSRLEGIPLALELAAARVRHLSLDQLLTRLSVRLDLLRGNRAALRSDHETLRTMLDWSYDLLDEDEQALLRRLSVFQGGWTLEMAEAVCAGDGVRQRDVLTLLGELESKSLVLHSHAEPSPRFRLLETIREYALERLKREGDVEATQGRHLQYWLSECQRGHIGGNTSITPELSSRLDVESSNLVSVLDWCTTQDGQVRRSGLELAIRSCRSWYDHDRSALGLRWLLALMVGTDAIDASNRAQGFSLASLMARQQGDLDGALQYAEKSLDISLTCRDERSISRALERLAGIHFLLGDYARAQESYEALLSRSDERGARRITLLANLGVVTWSQGRFGQARGYLEECIEIQSDASEVVDTGFVAMTLGGVAIDQGDYDAARTHLDSALRTMRSRDDRRVLPLCLGLLGRLDAATGEYESARGGLAEGLAMARESDVSSASAGLLGCSADLARQTGDLETALAQATEALELWREVGDPFEISEILNVLGLVSVGCGDLPTAADCFHESLSRAWKMGALAIASDAMEGMGRLAIAKAEFETATITLAAAAMLRESIGKALAPNEQSNHAAALKAAEQVLGASAFDQAWHRGLEMDLAEAVSFALGDKPDDEPPE